MTIAPRPSSTNLRTARIAAIGVYLPSTIRTTAETETLLRDLNPGLRIPAGLVRRLTGVERVFVRGEDEQASDLAVGAARHALEQSPGEVDLLIFASASQDLVEPATAHIVAAKLGITPPVMDIKNACNSVLNAMEVANALIGSGAYRRILIASGEGPSTAVRWKLEESAQFFRAFPGYTMSDAGAALILEAHDDPSVGIQSMRFHAVSKHWEVGTLPGGGTWRGHDPEAGYFDMDGTALHRAFLDLGTQPIHDVLTEQDLTWDDIDLVAIHQVALPFLPEIIRQLGVRSEAIVPLIRDYGNVASVALPLQIHLAREQGLIGPGSRILIVGLAGGISMGVAVVVL